MSGGVDETESAVLMRVLPRGWLSWDFLVIEGDRQVGSMELEWLREAGAVRLHENRYGLSRGESSASALERRSILLESEHGVLARAEQPFHRAGLFKITYGARVYSLEQTTYGGRAYTVREGDARRGSVVPTSALRRSAEVRLPGSWPLPLRLFVVSASWLPWLAVSLDRHDPSYNFAAAGKHHLTRARGLLDQLSQLVGSLVEVDRWDSHGEPQIQIPAAM